MFLIDYLERQQRQLHAVDPTNNLFDPVIRVVRNLAGFCQLFVIMRNHARSRTLQDNFGRLRIPAVLNTVVTTRGALRRALTGFFTEDVVDARSLDFAGRLARAMKNKFTKGPFYKLGKSMLEQLYDLLVQPPAGFSRGDARTFRNLFDHYHWLITNRTLAATNHKHVIWFAEIVIGAIEVFLMWSDMARDVLKHGNAFVPDDMIFDQLTEVVEAIPEGSRLKTRFEAFKRNVQRGRRRAAYTQLTRLINGFFDFACRLNVEEAYNQAMS